MKRDAAFFIENVTLKMGTSKDKARTCILITDSNRTGEKPNYKVVKQANKRFPFYNSFFPDFRRGKNGSKTKEKSSLIQTLVMSNLLSMYRFHDKSILFIGK